jgi:hypothetical protein
MDINGDVRDAAMEQLYDEFLARTWALHQVLASGTTDVTRRDVTAQLAAAANRQLAALAGSGRDQVAGRLHRLLWPSGAIPAANDPWWATPLGRFRQHDPALTAPDLASTTAAHVVLGRH